LHASLTLAAALLALWQLPIMNPSCYHKIIAGMTSQSTGDKDAEEPCSIKAYDGSDIPVNVLQ
jgi:hypothetical protein